jgi:TolB-like protein
MGDFIRDRLSASKKPERPDPKRGAAPAADICIAVLPFADMSGELSQEFFSDGITEEITAALAKVEGLRVVARTSAFEFKGRNHSIRTMGEALGASHLIEGSVRKAGDRVRVTARQNASRHISVPPALSTTGERAAGPISAAPWARTISSAIDAAYSRGSFFNSATKALNSSWLQAVPSFQNFNRASRLSFTHAMIEGAIWFTTRSGRLFANTRGSEVIETEKLG